MLDYVLFAVLWVLLSVLAELGVHAAAHHLYYFTASTQAVDGQSAMAFLLYFLTPIFVFVFLMLLFAFLRFRVRMNDKEYSVLQIKNNRAFIGVWITLSVLVNILFFLHPTTSAAEQMFNSANPANNKGTLVVDVVARQWEWIFSYPQYGITQAVNAAGNSTLYLPVNRKVEFVLRSYDPYHTYDYNADVIHSFWIPAFGVKEDVIPGETRLEYITPTKITSYQQNPMVRVQCAEICGPGHPYMESNVHVVSSSGFDKWVAAQHKLQNS